jgi:hypothetical protein
MICSLGEFTNNPAITHWAGCDFGMLIYTRGNMKDKRQLLDQYLAGMESAIREFREILRADRVPLGSSIAPFRQQLENFVAFFASLDQDQELEQRQQILAHIAQFIREKVDSYQNPLNISKSAACFLCKEFDPRLQIEPFPSQQTQRLIRATQDCLIAVKLHYEKLNDYGFCSRKTEIFFVKANEEKPTLTRVEEEISWESLPSEIRDIFLKQGKNRISFQIYPVSD